MPQVLIPHSLDMSCPAAPCTNNDNNKMRLSMVSLSFPEGSMHVLMALCGDVGLKHGAKGIAR